MSDFAIFKLVADAWGCGEMFRAWKSPEATFQILKVLSRHQPCDFSAIRNYAHIEAERGIQWPLAQFPQAGGDAAMTERRLFVDGRFFHADGRARFVFDHPRPMPELPDDEYPFILLTGRGSSAQWHTGSRTNKSAVLRKLAPATLTVDLHPDDAARLGIASSQRVSVSSRRGSLEAVAIVTATVQPGQIFLPMHFEAVNQLTLAAFDPHSRQPSYKACAVAVTAGPGHV